MKQKINKNKYNRTPVVKFLILRECVGAGQVDWEGFSIVVVHYSFTMFVNSLSDLQLTGLLATVEQQGGR